MTKANVFIICPCFNEAGGLETFVKDVREVFCGWFSNPENVQPGRLSLVLVEDGSRDETWKVISNLASHADGDISIHGLKFSRNFGHQAAICAGLDYVHSDMQSKPEDTVVILDSDGQHPPEFIPQLLAAREKGFHHVQMVRQDQGGPLLKRITSRWFYQIFNKLSGLNVPQGSADFRAFSGKFLSEYLRFEETNKFNRGIFHWLGFDTHYIPYQPAERQTGTSSYSFLKMLRLAARGITYFSSRPLVVTILANTIFGFLLIGAYGIYEIARWASGTPFVAGWPTIVFVVTLWGALNSLGQLLLALYVARIFDEVKRRPSYIVQEQVKPSRERSSTSLFKVEPQSVNR